jgi:hypothetical protein
MDSRSILLKSFLILLVIWILFRFWYIFVGIGLVTALVLIAKHFFVLLEVSTLKTTNVIFLPKQQAYAIPIDLFQQEREIVRTTANRTYKHRRKEWMVKSIRPELNGDQVEFVESIDRIDQAEIIPEDTHASNFDLNIARQVSRPSKDIYCKVQPKLIEFKQTVAELKQKEKLAKSSAIYTKQAQLFSRASEQVEKLIDDNERYRNQCLEFIRETLIGAELARFNPDILPDPLEWNLRLQTKRKELDEQFQKLRDEMATFSELSKIQSDDLET